MWRVYKEAGRPIPPYCDDDVVDYIVLEAVTLKALKEDEDSRKKRERKDWKKETENLKKFQ